MSITTYRSLYDEHLEHAKWVMKMWPSEVQAKIIDAAARRSVHMSLDDYLVAWSFYGERTRETNYEKARYLDQRDLDQLHKMPMMDNAGQRVMVTVDTAPATGVGSSTANFSTYNYLSEKYHWEKSRPVTRK